MDVHGELNLRQNGLRNAVFPPEQNFPLVPKPGLMVFKDKVLYVCAEIDGDLPVWVPLTKSLEMVRYTQATPSAEWQVIHNLKMNSVFVQVYDADGKWVIPDYISTALEDRVIVGFNLPIAGTAVVMRGQTDGAPQETIAFEQSFLNSATWVVNHQLGYLPAIRVLVGTNEVQPQSITHDSTMQATVRFSAPHTGQVRCI